MRLNTEPLCHNPLFGGKTELIRWVNAIAVGHTLNFDEISDPNAYPTAVLVGGSQCNIQYLTLLLRLGDLLDMRVARAAPDLLFLSEPLPTLSTAHWEQYAGLQLRDLKPRSTIIIGGTCPSQEAERVLREWVTWLQREAERAVLLVNAGPSEYSLPIGRIEYAVQPEKDANQQPKYEFLNYRFNLDEEQIFKRLFGSRLYGREAAAIRELIQNAVDATRIRIAVECAASPLWRALSKERRVTVYREAFRKRAPHLPLELSIETKSVIGGIETWLSVSDHGIGMSRSVIEQFLLKVGRTRWREDPLVKEIGIRTIGEFGMGFLSTFMLSERTVIETKSCLPTDPGIRATIFNWRGYLATEPFERDGPGTTVRMRLKKELVPAFADLAEVIQHWCPFVELPIRVTGRDGEEQLLEPERPGRASARQNGVSFLLGAEESVGFVSNDPMYGNPTAPPYCQDGLIVPDIPPPLGDSPAERAARQFGIRVDLRGEDRLPLDLSRNLAEGGHEQIWAKLVPKFWSGLVKNGLKLAPARRALSDYIQEEYFISRGTNIAIVGPGGAFRPVMLPCELPESIRLGDLHRDGLDKLADGDVPSLLMPHLPEAALAYEHASAEEVVSENTKSPWGRAFNFWRRRGATFTMLLEDEVNTKPVSMASFPLLLEPLSKYLYVGREGGFTKLSVNSSDGAIPLASLGLVRLTKNWWLIRSPQTGKLHVLGDLEADLILDALPPTVTFPQFAIALCHDVWSDVPWGFGWPGTPDGWLERQVAKCRMDAEAEVRELRRAKREKVRRARAFAESYDPDEDDNPSEWNSDEGTEELTGNGADDLEPGSPERARAERLGPDADSFVAAFIISLDRSTDWRLIAGGLTPWDGVEFTKSMEARNQGRRHAE